MGAPFSQGFALGCTIPALQAGKPPFHGPQQASPNHDRLRVLRVDRRSVASQLAFALEELLGQLGRDFVVLYGADEARHGGGLDFE